MYTLLLAAPAIIALLLWLDWFKQGGGGLIAKIIVLLVILSAASLQFLLGYQLLGLLLQIPIATGLLLWKRWDRARGW
jgi:hypothetical protein